MYLLPSTSGNTIWPVLEEGCATDSEVNCEDLRGGLFKRNSSTSWDKLGVFELGTWEEQKLGYDNSMGTFGFDDAKFGFPNDNGLIAKHQVIQGFMTRDFYLGAIGLNPNAVNMTSFNDPTPSLLQSLKDQGSIPSRSWGYTAGKSYLTPPVFGSLTLGGYDGARARSNDVTFPFGPDQTRDLLLDLRSISSSASKHLLLTGDGTINIWLDSLVPDIWLPKEACQRFEDIFSLSYNSSISKYTVNDTIHTTLIAQNPNVTFEFGAVGNEPSKQKTVSITMQYKSFDLVYNTTETGETTRYFPLQQADNSSQYTFGRAFFQDAYVVADYERYNFKVFQASIPDSSTSQKIVSILPPGAEQKRMSTAAIAGVAVGASVFITIVLVGGFLWRKRRSRSKDEPEESPKPSGKDNSDEYFKPELSASQERYEMPADPIDPWQQLDGVEKHEMPSDSHLNLLRELSDNEKKHELATSIHDAKPLPELPGKFLVPEMATHRGRQSSYGGVTVSELSSGSSNRSPSASGSSTQVTSPSPAPSSEPAFRGSHVF